MKLKTTSIQYILMYHCHSLAAVIEITKSMLVKCTDSNYADISNTILMCHCHLLAEVVDIEKQFVEIKRKNKDNSSAITFLVDVP